MKLWTLVIVAALSLATLEAEAARRLGGGQSIGKQSSNVTQRDAPAPAQAAPQGTQVAQKSPAQQPGAPAAAPQRSGFGGMLGGLAAGLGLAWLAHTLGFGEAFASIMLFALLGVLIAVAVALFLRSRNGATAAASSPFAFQAAGPAPETTTTPRQYNPEKIGNDASARPWERSSMAFDAGKYGAAANVRIGSALEGSQSWGVPAGFDTAGFVEAAKRNFVTLQGAWDRSDVPLLRSMMTDEMAAEIGKQLSARQADGAAPNRTDIVMLEAKLLGIEDLGDAYMASVEFSGMIREEPSAGPSPFREVWNMTKPKSGESGWLVAGVQALQ